MSKDYKESAQYYHAPFALMREPRVQVLKQRMGINGTGILLHIYMLLRQCNGKFPLDSILALARGRLQEKKIRSVLNDYDLFTIDNGIVQLQTGLSAAKLKPNSTVPPKDKPGMIRERIRQGYDDNTSTSRTINVTQNLSLTASFKAVSSGGSTEPGGEDDDDNPAFL